MSDINDSLVNASEKKTTAEKTEEKIEEKPEENMDIKANADAETLTVDLVGTENITNQKSSSASIQHNKSTATEKESAADIVRENEQENVTCETVVKSSSSVEREEGVGSEISSKQETRKTEQLSNQKPEVDMKEAEGEEAGDVKHSTGDTAEKKMESQEIVEAETMITPAMPVKIKPAFTEGSIAGSVRGDSGNEAVKPKKSGDTTDEQFKSTETSKKASVLSAFSSDDLNTQKTMKKITKTNHSEKIKTDTITEDKCAKIDSKAGQSKSRQNAKTETNESTGGRAMQIKGKQSREVDEVLKVADAETSVQSEQRVHAELSVTRTENKNSISPGEQALCEEDPEVDATAVGDQSASLHTRVRLGPNLISKAEKVQDAEVEKDRADEKEAAEKHNRRMEASEIGESELSAV